MDFSNDKFLIILIFSLAIVASYIFLQRTFGSEDETKKATHWYNRKIGWQVRKTDLDETSRYIEKSGKIFGLIALISWVILFYLLK